MHLFFRHGKRVAVSEVPYHYASHQKNVLQLQVMLLQRAGLEVLSHQVGLHVSACLPSIHELFQAVSLLQAPLWPSHQIPPVALQVLLNGSNVPAEAAAARRTALSRGRQMHM